MNTTASFCDLFLTGEESLKYMFYQFQTQVKWVYCFSQMEPDELENMNNIYRPFLATLTRQNKHFRKNVSITTCQPKKTHA